LAAEPLQDVTVKLAGSLGHVEKIMPSVDPPAIASSLWVDISIVQPRIVR